MVDSLGDSGAWPEGIAESKITEFAGEAMAADAAVMRDVAPLKRMALLACVVSSGAADPLPSGERTRVAWRISAVDPRRGRRRSPAPLLQLASGAIGATDPDSIAQLLDYRRQVAELYAAVRAADDPSAAHARWRARRGELYAGHPQSPVSEDQRAGYAGPHAWDYDPAWRLLASVEPAAREMLELPSSDGATMRFVRFARARSEAVSLDLYWLDGYGGGLFVPFADATSGSETYGAGRYVLDTIKGADLGTECGLLVLDLNFAYQPSCSYDARWTCPLAPPTNRLELAVRAGERSSASRRSA